MLVAKVLPEFFEGQYFMYLNKLYVPLNDYDLNDSKHPHQHQAKLINFIASCYLSLQQTETHCLR